MQGISESYILELSTTAHVLSDVELLHITRTEKSIAIPKTHNHA